MEVRIDKAGRIVVPKALRERLGFRPDTSLEVIEQPEGVLLKRPFNGLPYWWSMVCEFTKASRKQERTGIASWTTCERNGLSPF